MRIWRPYTQEQTTPLPFKVASADGAYLHLADGRRIFDGISSWWLVSHGHACPEIRAAIVEQSQKLSQVVFANFTYEGAEQLSETLGEFLPPSLANMFFSDNGSTAVEVAMKMAYQISASSGRRKFLAFERSYHGDTCGAMSVSRSGEFTENYKGLLFDVVRCKQGVSTQDSIETWTSDFLKKLEEHSDICAVILEPLIQGAGGMVVWPKSAVQLICREAQKRGIFVIFDEVMTGFGRTGTMFAFQQLDCTPDLLCLSKGLTGGFLPMGLTVATDSIFEAFLSENPGRMLFHGHSFTGNALSCAAALANLKLWKSSDVQGKLDGICHAQVTALGRSPTGLPIKERRTCGTIGVMELDLPDGYGSRFSKYVSRECLKRGIFLRTLGSTVYLMPPYCATPNEVLQAWDQVFAVIQEFGMIQRKTPGDEPSFETSPVVKRGSTLSDASVQKSKGDANS